MAVTGRAGFKHKVRKPASRAPSPPATRFDHADDRLNRAGATPEVRRGFKFRQFETNEFARAGKFAQ